MTQSRSWILAAGFGLMFAAPAVGQGNPTRLTFDVVSIKLSDPNEEGGWIRPLPGGNGYTCENVSLRGMISAMYRVPPRQIVGGPDWLTNEGYNIEARADRAYSLDELREMFRNLLADRFNLKFHKDIKRGPVFALVVDKPGLKMKADGRGQNLQASIAFSGGNQYVGKKVPMEYLCFFLGQAVQRDGRPVIDKTGLTDDFDFTLSFAPEMPPGAPGENLSPEVQNLPSIFEAVRQQLGLRLDPQKGTIEYYVVDHIDRPTPN